MKKPLLVTASVFLGLIALQGAPEARGNSGAPGAGGGSAGGATPVQSEDNAYSNIALLTRAIQLIRQDYVDEKKTSYRALTYAALKGMFSSLDPHSSFLEPHELKGMEDDTKSEFTGLGVTVTVRDGTLTIVTPLEDTPGFHAGLLPGDQILRINGESTEKLELGAAIERLRGLPGEKISLTILRPATRKIEEFEIVRAVIKVQSVKDAKILDPAATNGRKIGYVRITQFSEPTARELAAKLDGLEKQGMEALILDLRNNPGGLLESAVGVCGEFLPPNTVVVSTEGRLASQKAVYRTPLKSKGRPKYPVAILINGGSASGSEIVAGALKDLNRAVLIGETTFGKGSVQSVISLLQNSGARFTTAKYYTPSRQVIHEKGVSPHIRATMTPDEEQAFFMARREYLTPAEKAELANFKDVQLERAIDAVASAVVFLEGQNALSLTKTKAGLNENLGPSKAKHQ